MKRFLKTKPVQNIHCNKPISVIWAPNIAFIGNDSNKKAFLIKYGLYAENIGISLPIPEFHLPL